MTTSIQARPDQVSMIRDQIRRDGAVSVIDYICKTGGLQAYTAAPDIIEAVLAVLPPENAPRPHVQLTEAVNLLIEQRQLIAARALIAHFGGYDWLPEWDALGDVTLVHLYEAQVQGAERKCSTLDDGGVPGDMPVIEAEAGPSAGSVVQSSRGLNIEQKKRPGRKRKVV